MKCARCRATRGIAKRLNDEYLCDKCAGRVQPSPVRVNKLLHVPQSAVGSDNNAAAIATQQDLSLPRPIHSSNGKVGDLSCSGELSSPPKDHKCVSCLCDLNDEDSKCISCDICKDWECIECGKVSPEQYDILMQITNLTWVCNKCKPTMETMSKFAEKLNKFERDQEHISRSLHNLDETIHAAVQAEISDLHAVIKEEISAEVSNQVSAVERRFDVKIDEIHSQLVQANTQINSQGQSQPQSCPAEEVMYSIIDEKLSEEREIERRRTNVVLFQLPESENTNILERKSEDIALTTRMLREAEIIDITNSEILRAFRIGKKQENKVRPVCISLPDKATRNHILYNAYKLASKGEEFEFRKVGIAPDLTPKQRESRKKLRDELNARREAGEQDLVIRRGKIIRSRAQDTTNHPRPNQVTFQGE